MGYKLVTITKAELVTLGDGNTHYELTGKDSAGKTIELHVDPEGGVLGAEK